MIYPSKRQVLSWARLVLVAAGALLVGSDSPELVGGAPSSGNPVVLAEGRPSPFPPRRLNPGDCHLYRLSLKKSGFLSLAVEQQGIDVVVSVRGPNGRRLLQVDSPNGTAGPEPLLFVAPVAGRYFLEIEGSAENGAGAYSISVLEPPRPASDIDHARARGFRLLTEADEDRRQGSERRARVAVQRYEAAAPLLDTSGEAVLAAAAWERQAWTLLRLHQPRLAANALLQAQEQLASLEAERVALLRVTMRLGAALHASDSPEAATTTYRRALAFARELGRTRDEAVIWNDLGLLAEPAGRTEEALRAYREALALWRRLGNKVEEANTLGNLGDLYLQLGGVARGRAQIDEALVLQDRLGDVGGRQASEIKLAAALRLSAKEEESRRLLEKLLAEKPPLPPRLAVAAWINLGVAELRRDPKAALQAFRQAERLAVEIEDVFQASTARFYQGWCLLEEGRHEEAGAAFNQLITATRQRGQPAFEASALLGRARSLRALGNLEEASQILEQALSLVEAKREGLPLVGLRASYLSTRHDYYHFAIETLMLRHRANPTAGFNLQAFAMAERGRARAMLDRLVASEEASQSAELGEPIRGTGWAEHLTERELARLDQERTRGRQPTDLSTPIALERLQAHLDAETVVLAYSLGEPTSVLFAIRRDSFASYELRGEAALREIARTVLRRLTVEPSWPEAVARGGEAQELARALLQPAAELLSSAQRVVLVPDGFLARLPFGALPDPERPYQPWAASVEIVSAPSASVLLRLRDRRRARPLAAQATAIVANPVFKGHENLRPLPGTGREAAALAALVPADSCLRLEGAAATRATVLAADLSRFRLLHLATHTFTAAASAELSGLALTALDSESRDREGFLPIHEIYQLNLRAELAVLSGCRTALGEELRGEGIQGLAQAFLQAGASSVLVSLWNVADDDTAELMERFYHGLYRLRLSPAAALRRAQLEMWRAPEPAPPRVWAAFHLIGDWLADPVE